MILQGKFNVVLGQITRNCTLFSTPNINLGIVNGYRQSITEIKDRNKYTGYFTFCDFKYQLHLSLPCDELETKEFQIVPRHFY